MIHLKLDDLISDPGLCMTFEHFTFNGGEEHIRIKPVIESALKSEVLIEASLVNSAKIMQVLIAANALRRMGFGKISLLAPYIPYSRQDRYCNEGEALSIKVMCAILNAQNFNKVYTLDNHSDVTSALLNHQVDINVSKIICRVMSETTVEKGDNFTRYALVSPDAGALKKTYKISKDLGGIPIIECGKRREVATGKITKTIVYDEGCSKFEKLLIVDDICDGGRTFIELAKELKKMGARKIELYVSHGIFSQGVKPLTCKEEPYNGLFEEVYTTKSYKNSVTDKIGESFLMRDIEN